MDAGADSRTGHGSGRLARRESMMRGRSWCCHFPCAYTEKGLVHIAVLPLLPERVVQLFFQFELLQLSPLALLSHAGYF